ncbi:MAG: RdgB/HAM1 family non-canonical purine NTP pyrophosphatase [Myxococcota bacterium]|nr:RdgB/HAM1 family non-canonical purine NTP pyrophosphatase [Myxococcota bacterium]
MKPRLLFATTNPGKLGELRALMGEAAQVLSLKDFPQVSEAVEDGATFEENARKKAHHYAVATGVVALADDSGLCVDALGGAPGVHSARYAEGSDRARYLKLLEVLAGVPDSQRGAAFQCALCLATPEGADAVEVGACPGTIGREPRGSHGFGYDPVFLLPDGRRTMAELPKEEKSAISHRGAAFVKLRPVLLAYTQGRWPSGKEI